MGTVHSYSTERIAPVKLRRVVDGLMVPESIPSVDVIWLSDVVRITISEVERNYRRERGASDGEWRSIC